MAKSKKPPPSEVPPPEKQPPVQKEPEASIAGLTPWTVFQAALKAVPSLRYALAVLGIVSAIAIIKGFGIDFRVAVFGTIIMVVLMVAVVVFAALTKVRSPQVRSAALVLMWSLLTLTILSAALLFTSAFFDYPKQLSQLFGLTDRQPAKVGTGQEPKPKDAIESFAKNEDSVKKADDKQILHASTCTRFAGSLIASASA